MRTSHYIAFGYLFVAAFLLPTALSATDYEVTVTRVARDLYVIDGKDVMLRTRGCVEYGGSEPGRLMMGDGAGTLRFLGSAQECAVTEVFGPVAQQPGEFPVHVHVIGPRWVRLEEQDLHLKLAGPGWKHSRKDFRATLHIAEDGQHELSWRGQTYEVEGLYTAIEL